METQANKYQRDLDFDIRDLVWVSTRNQKTGRSSWKLDYYMAGLYKILEKVGHSYRVDLLETIWVHLIFLLNKLQKALDDPLPKQKNELLLPIQVGSNDKQEVEEILASKIVQRTLQYWVSWKGYDPNPIKYPAWNFVGCLRKLREFHDSYPDQLGPPKYLDEWINCQDTDEQLVEHWDKNALKACP